MIAIGCSWYLLLFTYFLLLMLRASERGKICIVLRVSDVMDFYFAINSVSLNNLNQEKS